VLALLVVACSRSGTATVTVPPEPIRPGGTITARELPDPLLDNYELNREAQREQREAQTGYRIGTLNTVLLVCPTPAGPVFADPGGGGMAWSESCEAMHTFVQANGWTDASACLDGTRQP
jgi:hypothetical protein